MLSIYVKLGVPQGTFLDSLVFLVFLNDITGHNLFPKN